MKKGQHINSIKETVFLLEEKDFFRLNVGKAYTYKSIYGVENTIAENFLCYLLKKDDWYEYFNRMIDTDKGTLKFGYLMYDNLGQSVSIDISDAIKLLDRMALNKTDRVRLKEIKKKCSVAVLLEKTKEDYYTTLVGEEEETVSVNRILQFLLLDETTFQEAFKHSTILGLNKDKFVYILTKYLKKQRIFQKYRFNENIIKRYDDLLLQKYVDFQKFEFYEDDYEFRYPVDLNENLKEIIYKGMNTYYSDLEKSIYVYIKLCKLFSYDPKTYASGQQGNSMDYHRNLVRIGSIEDGNEDIVCYEFNVIYGKFLDDLNIKYRINAKKPEKAYGRGHANLTYNTDKYIVFADAVTSIINGDLINAKLNLPLEGLRCENVSSQSKKEFKQITEKIYADVIEQENKEGINVSTTLDYLKIYKGTTIDEDIDLDKKIKLLIELTNKSGLKIVDAIGYMNKLKKILFTKEELDKNIDISVIRTNIKNDKNLGIVITKFDIENKIYKYWYYSPTKKIIPINIIVLRQLIKKGIIEAIEGTKRVIPGIGEVTRR